MNARIIWLCLAVLLTPVAVLAEDCLMLRDPAKPEVRLLIQLTSYGATQLEGALLAFLHVRRAAEPPASEIRAVRLLTGLGPDRSTRFTFARSGEYWISVHKATDYGWPQNEHGVPVKGCSEQRIVVVGDKRPEFAGTRSHAWIAYRPATRFEVAGSVYVGRLGVAGIFETAPFGGDDDINRWNAGGELRWRGARGYLGGGIRYYPSDEPDRHRVRPVFVAGEELPPFKRHPTWLMLDLRVDRKWEKSFLKTLRLQDLSLSAGVRIDITRDYP